MTDDLRAVLLDGLRGLDQRFRPGELAYLALTSKVELPLRDRLAFGLHERLWPEAVVAREHPVRTDLAILTPDGAPRLLLEAKAFYSFDAARDPEWNKYRQRVVDDVAKAHRVAIESTEVFALAIVTHPLVVGRTPPGVIKYEPGVAHALMTHGTAAKVLELADENLRTGMASLGPVHSGAIDAGQAMNVDVQLVWYLIGPTWSS